MPEGMGEGRRGAMTRVLRVRTLHVRRDEEAAAGVVSILLAILTIILMITIITSFWMPEWMETIEQDHTRLVTGQFGKLKSAIDKQILLDDTKFVVGNPIKLGAEGFSVFGSDSRGTFSINHFREGDLEYYCNIRNATGEVNVTCTGGMKYKSNNIYYVDQQLAYENGAIILNQGEGQVLRTSPQFSVEAHGPMVHISFVLITINGVPTSITGTGTVLVQTQLITQTTADILYESPEPTTITTVTEFPLAWARYFNNTLIQAGLAPGADFTTTVTAGRVVVVIQNVQHFNMGYALMDVQLEENDGGVATGPTVPGLVGLFHLNENEGVMTRDSSTLHNDGTIWDGTWATGVRGACVAFDGVDDHVDVPEIPEYNMVDEITVMAWVRWGVEPWNGDPWANILCKDEDQWQLQHSGDAMGTTHTNDAFEFSLRTNETRKWIWSTTVPGPNIWYHVTGRFNTTTSELAIFVNGTKEGSEVLNGTIELRVNDLTIGARFDSGSHDRYFEGDIDEVIIFDRALSDQEIKGFYQSLKP